MQFPLNVSYHSEETGSLVTSATGCKIVSVESLRDNKRLVTVLVEDERDYEILKGYIFGEYICNEEEVIDGVLLTPSKLGKNLGLTRRQKLEIQFRQNIHLKGYIYKDASGMCFEVNDQAFCKCPMFLTIGKLERWFEVFLTGMTYGASQMLRM